MASPVRVVHGWATSAIAVVSAEEEDACDALQRIHKALVQQQQPPPQAQQPGSLHAQLQAAVGAQAAL